MEAKALVYLIGSRWELGPGIGYLARLGPHQIAICINKLWRARGGDWGYGYGLWGRGPDDTAEHCYF